MAHVAATEGYQDLATQIIQKQATILGAAVAVRRARAVAGLEVDDTGKVIVMPADTDRVFAELVEQYKSLSGAIGVDFCRQALASWAGTHPGAQVPSALL